LKGAIEQMLELIDYQNVPIGFEVALVADKEVTIPLWSGGMFMAKAEDWDDEVRFINKLQMRLPKLGTNARMLRLQIIGNEQCHYKFFQNNLKILQGIGDMRPRKDVMGHVPNLPDYIRSLENERIEMGKAYLRVLELWFEGKSTGEAKHTLPKFKSFVDSIYQTLGERTPLKKLYVERMIISFSYPILHWSGEADLSNIAGKTVDVFGINHPRGLEIDQKIAQTKRINLTYGPRIFGNKKQFGDDTLAHIVYRGRGLCNHKFFRHVQIILNSIGKGEWRKDDPPQAKERTQLAARISDYVFALDSWLAELDEKKAIAEDPDALKVINEVYATLGDRSQVKEWLVASLWKTMKDNKKYFKIVNVDKDSIKFIPHIANKYGLERSDCNHI